MAHRKLYEKRIWPGYLEKIYEDVPYILVKLHEKYKLGIITD